MKRTLLYEILVVSLTALGGAAAWYFGLINQIMIADTTKLTWVMLAIYTWFTGEILRAAYKNDTSKTGRFEFISDILPAMGLLGTVAGLIIATSGPLAEALDDPKKIKDVLGAMSNGVGAALYTTGCGIVGATLMKIQNRILSKGGN